MALNDAWLESLDIPDKPDFGDPGFNAYAYDGADQWFENHRETAPSDTLQSLKTAIIMVDTPVQRETYTSEESSQDDHSSVGVGSSMEHRVDVTIPTPRLQRSISSHSAKKDSRTARARSPKSGTSANSDPGSQGHNDPKPARRSPVAPVVKSVPQVLKIAAKPPITLKPVEQQIVNPPRRLHAHMKPHVPAPHAAVPPRRPLGSGPHRDQAPKRRSVAPASAGEYFAHILREYPDGKCGPSWK